MTRLLLGVAAIAVLLLAAGVYRQHVHYLAARRGPVQDRQPLWYPAASFHAVTFLEVPDDRTVIGEVRRLRDAIEGAGDARLVYAGQAAFVGLQSAQLPPIDWNAVLLVQYPTRSAYDTMAENAGYQAVLADIPHAYSMGMERPRLLNLAIHQALLLLKLRDRVTFAPSRFPFEKAEQTQDPNGRDRAAEFAKLASLKPLGEDAIVVVNLLKRGTPEQQAADRGYGLQMAGGFAEGGYGPMHIGRAVELEGDAEYDQVALVYYPGIDFMRSMIESSFFQGIVGGKQPGDTLAVITVPILGEL